MFSFVKIILFGQVSYSSNIVDIFVHLNDGKGATGTGFFVSINGQAYIMTCFHVIAGASRIDIASCTDPALQNNIPVIAYDDINDFALLKCPYKNANTIPINYSIPSQLMSYNGVTEGFPDGNVNQQFEVKFTRNSTESANDLRDGNTEIYKDFATFPVLPFASVIYGGMSGAPIIVNNAAIGIVAGSLTSGGALCWGIPFSNMTLIWNSPNTQVLRSINYSPKPLLRSVVYDDDVSLSYSPIEDVWTEIQTSFNLYLSDRKNQHILISNTISLINSLNNLSDQIENKLRIDSMMLVIINDENTQGQEPNNFNNDLNSFTTINQQIVQNADIDESTFEKIGLGVTEMNKINQRINLYRINYTSADIFNSE